eukprot:Protomagalhaensia_sp_Gyna_25__496@NODE_1235_length_2039_cov_20_101000_g986_i0_p1_GENE_NODE_1235_length_2039_cov_20_101000_g986_i0NODE_1235_length_2039_cov_20_101000_g986_i0_p1_ORF_typecomplete_len652_score134_88RFC1/PF08519_12/1e02RFC1/PF08519_12/1_9e30AAA/PF00004_29/1_4e12AAA/PF00004_29/3e03Rad17/PF03215_15/2_5e12BRCT/PF00533_26/3_7e07AAA_5/PF07728_14/7_2e07RuvB_N/PF05496_12/6_1e07NACHT/PF05729_12/4_2e03NACHT/PF05729_12/8_5e05AAA_2/PF07724_14/0_00018AAA_22/PF13401_6/0_0015AAA_16/PF13191_6/0_000
MPPKRGKRNLSVLEADSPSVKKVARKSTCESGSSGLKVVLTGEPETMGREHLEALITRAGMRVTSAVSGVTNILIVGAKLEDGRPVNEGSKYKKAQQLLSEGKSKGGLEILTEAQFFTRFADLMPESGATAPPPAVLEPSSQHYLWSEKWRPRSPALFAFNVEAFRSIEDWFKHWDSSKENERAALLAGPPGVGKTSAVIALADMCQTKLLEFNASDTRGQKQLRQLQALITGGFSLSKGEVQEKVLLLMDEADGLSSGDRGGAQELVKLIKLSKVPIICTCNDKQHPKVRTLAKSCRVIDFKKCDRLAAVRRAMQIAEKEGHRVSESFVNTIYDAADGDMRQLLNGLQGALVARPTQPGSLQKYVLKDPNQNEDAFMVAKRLFSSSDLTNRQRLDAFFVDYDLVPLIIHENYLRLLIKDPNGLATARLVSDAMCYADIINARIRGNSQWELLPDYGFFSTVLPTKKVRGSLWRVDFPKFLGRISSTNKHKRQFGELAAKTGRAGRRLITDGYYEALGDELMEVLGDQNLDVPERIEEFFDDLGSYGLTRDLVLENLMETRYTRNTPTPYDKVDTKVKTALTRAWNARVQPGQVRKKNSRGKKPASGSSPGKTTSAGKSTPGADDDDTEFEADSEVLREREEEERKMGGIM